MAASGLIARSARAAPAAARTPGSRSSRARGPGGVFGEHVHEGLRVVQGLSQRQVRAVGPLA
ncbi:MAG TPA: hypothetical protein DCZ01_02435 [Elusimicrobia bacterium]|nr:MAG: hypothetical protein A2X37_09970 [Elusimicrobia bacterium GWA2_66_18]HAZ07386.1 hypothetical protein [Elusimicrobiota bacterium]